MVDSDATHPAADLEGRLAGLEGQVLAVMENVRDLAATVARLAQHAPPAGFAGSQTPRTGDERVGEDLVEWVRWLVRHYEQAIIPECWAEHGAFVAELAALYAGWQATIGEGTTGMEAMQWHDLAGRAFERLKSPLYRTCLDGTHRDWTAPPWATGGNDG